MKGILKYSLIMAVCLLVSCGSKEVATAPNTNKAPQVTENGKKIVFPDSANVAFFETEQIGSMSLKADINAPAKVSATVVKSESGASQNIVFFENPDLASNYTQLIQHLTNINQIQNVNIRQKKIELERTKDLLAHGAATGKDLLDAQSQLSIEQTNLSNERAAIIEHETKLKANGFQAEVLRKAAPGTAYIICSIPESQISKIKQGGVCEINFTSFPNEKFTGKIDGVADMIDQTTRMIKLRVSVNNANGKLKAGMFATVAFKEDEGNSITVSKNALVTIQAKNYVFVKSGANAFERREISTGSQVGDRIIVYSGLQNAESVAVKGVMQLKGLSFGY